MSANWSGIDPDGGQYTEFATHYNSGYRDGVKAERERSKSALAQVREKCAKTCEAQAEKFNGSPPSNGFACWWLRHCAAAIRAIKL